MVVLIVLLLHRMTLKNMNFIQKVIEPQKLISEVSIPINDFKKVEQTPDIQDY